MSANAVPQVQKSATPIPPVATQVTLGNVRAFTDETAIQEQESSSTDSQVAAAASPPPEESDNHSTNLNYNFSLVSVTDYVPATVQTKLVVGAPGDKYEQEADVMADKVMSMTPSLQKQEELIEEKPDIQAQPVADNFQNPKEEEGTVHLKSLAATIQRQTEEEGTVHLKPLAATIQRKEIEGVVHLKPLANQVSPTVQQTLKNSTLISRKGNGGFTASESVETRLKSGKGSGQPLPNETRDFMESRFGNDFSGVKVHTGSDSVQLSKELGAQAFTHGEDIYFNSGKYSPHTDEGKKLLAHELTHTIQQTGPKIKKKPLKISRKPNQIQRQRALAKFNYAPQNEQISPQKLTEKIFTKADDKKEEKESVKLTENRGQDKEKLEDKNKTSADVGSGKEQEPQTDQKAGTDANAKEGEGEAGGQADKEGEGKEGDAGSVGNVGGGESASGDVAFEPINIFHDPDREAPDSPEADPAFQGVIKQTEGVNKQYIKHPDPAKKATEAQQAADDPKKQERDAQATKVEETSQQETKAFDRTSFEQAILDKLGMAIPNNEKEAENFPKSNKLGEVKNQLNQNLERNKQNASGGLPEANRTPPDASKESAKEVQPIPDIKEDIGKEQPTVEADKAVPKEKSEKEIEKPLEKTAQNLDKTFGNIQPKLVVGAPGDKYEQEADRMAEQVMAMPESEMTQSEAAASYESESQPQVQNQIESVAKAENSPLISEAENEQLLAAGIQRVQLFIQRKESLEAPSIEQPEKAVPLNKERLETWSEMGGSQAITALKDAKKHTKEGPKQYRQGEEGQLTTAKGEAVGEADKTNQEMFADRDTKMNQVAASQEQTKTEDEKKREKITADIDKIYRDTKSSVDTRLKKLDDDVNKEFERGSRISKNRFEGYVARKMAAYKEKRYSGWGVFNKIGDFFSGLPEEVNKFYEEGKQLYLDEMKKSISKIAGIVETGLNEAKQLVDKGRQQVNNYVKSLPEDLKQVGAESAANIQSQFDSLEQSIQDKQNQLVESLAAKYQANLEELDKRIEKLKEENKGLVDKALKAIADVAKAIVKAVLTPIKKILEVAIGGMASKVIDAIINDPGQFMMNLFKGIGDGIKNFASNIGKHLLNGLVTWLFGNIGSELKLPEKFDLKGFLDILLQILGLTKDYIFGLAEQVLGGNVIGLIKFVIDFIIKNGSDSLKVLWDLVKMIGEVGIDAIVFLIKEGADAIESLPENVQNGFKSFGGGVQTILGFAESLIGSLGEDVLQLVGGLGKGVKFLFDFFATLFKEGVTATWKFIKSSIGTLKSIFMGDLSQMLIVEVVKQGVIWLISMLNPASGIAKIAKAIYDVVNFFIERKDEIKALVDTILNTLKSIIEGKPGEMASMIEQALANAIPNVLGFLASLLGIGGIPGKIQKIFTKLRAPITKVITSIVEKVKGFFKGIGRAVKKGYNKAKGAVKKAYNKAKKAVKRGYYKAKGAVKKAFKGDKKKEKVKSKDNAKKRLSPAYKQAQNLVKKLRDPEKVKNQLSSIGSQHKIEQLKVKKKGWFGSTSKYEVVGKTKQIKVQRQIESGASISPVGEVRGGLLLSSNSMNLQLKKENPWESKTSKLTVKNSLKGDKKKANFLIQVEVKTQKKILKELAKKLKEIAKSQVKCEVVEKKLPRLKKRYKLQSLTIAPLNKAKTKYQIQAIAPSEQSTQAQREAIPGASCAIDGSGVEEAIQRSQGKGEKLDRTVRSPMENAFGFDFSNVRIHADTEGDRLSRSLEARAFTTGSDIFFRQGAYAPESSTGKRLLAHELTHVVQQSGESSSASRSNPLLSRTVQRVSETAPYFVQREANSDANAEQNKAEMKAKGMILLGTGMAVAGNLLSSGNEAQVSTSKKINQNQLTMKVTVKKPQEQTQDTSAPAAEEEEQQALPDELVYDIVKLIQQIVNQYPDPDIVQKKLDKVCVDFDLDLLKVIGSATIGTSISYEIQVKGRPQKPKEENPAAIAKKLDTLTPKKEESKSESGGFWSSLFAKSSPSKSKAKETNSGKVGGKTAQEQKVKSEKSEKEKVKPEKPKQTMEAEAKEKQANKELKQEKEAAKSKSPNSNVKPMPELDVNTKVKRTDPATVEISVRADRKKK